MNEEVGKKMSGVYPAILSYSALDVQEQSVESSIRVASGV